MIKPVLSIHPRWREVEELQKSISSLEAKKGVIMSEICNDFFGGMVFDDVKTPIVDEPKFFGW